MERIVGYYDSIDNDYYCRKHGEQHMREVRAYRPRPIRVEPVKRPILRRFRDTTFKGECCYCLKSIYA